MGPLAPVHLGTLDSFVTLAPSHALLAITSTVVTAAVVSCVWSVCVECVCVCVCVCMCVWSVYVCVEFVCVYCVCVVSVCVVCLYVCVCGVGVCGCV